MNTIILENWRTVLLDPYSPPEAGMRLSGEVYDHPRFQNGTVVTTSRVNKINCRFITTKSGSLYWLGKPDPNFVKWCKEHGGHVPTDMEPIKVKG